MFWADTQGADYIYRRLEEWTKVYGECFKPCAFLAERAAKGIPLVRTKIKPCLHYVNSAGTSSLSFLIVSHLMQSAPSNQAKARL